MPAVLRSGEVADGGHLGNYYLDLSEAAPFIASGAVGPLDADGIPMADYDVAFRGHPAADPERRYGVHYTPVTTAEYALGNLGCYLTTRDPNFRGVFIRQADWLRRNLTVGARFGVWLHTFEFPPYGLAAPWVSAMAQGEGVSVLLRAHEMTRDPVYLTAACHAFGAFLHDFSEQGVSVRDEHGDLWLEEFPTTPPVHVLNGFIFALWGVLDFYRVTRDSRARSVWEEGVQTLRKNLHRYELNWWSRYDLRSRSACSAHYHRTHVRQLFVMADLADEPVFAEYAKRWQAFADGRRRRRRFAGRVARGLLRRAGLLPERAVRGVSVSSSQCADLKAGGSGQPTVDCTDR
jgi:hypothetical protein